MSYMTLAAIISLSVSIFWMLAHMLLSKPKVYYVRRWSLAEVKPSDN